MLYVIDISNPQPAGAEVGAADRVHPHGRAGDLRPPRAAGGRDRPHRLVHPGVQVRLPGGHGARESRSSTCATRPRRSWQVASSRRPPASPPTTCRWTETGSRGSSAATEPRLTTCAIPLKPKMVMRTDENIMNSGQLGFPGPDPVFGIGGKGETPIDLIHHDSLRFHKKARSAASSRKAGKTYPAGGTGNVVGIVEEDYNRPDLRGSRQLPDLGHHRPAHLHRRAQARAARPVRDGARRASSRVAGWAPVTGLCSAHYFDERDGLVAGGWYEEGTRFLDVTRPGRHPPGGLLGADQGRDLVGALRADRPERVDRLRARLRSRHRRAALRPLGSADPTAPVRRSWLKRRAEQRSAARSAQPRRRAAAAPGSPAAASSASSAACRAGSRGRRRRRRFRASSRCCPLSDRRLQPALNARK